jgi:hypothetical protein
LEWILIIGQMAFGKDEFEEDVFFFLDVRYINALRWWWTEDSLQTRDSLLTYGRDPHYYVTDDWLVPGNSGPGGCWAEEEKAPPRGGIPLGRTDDPAAAPPRMSFWWR